MRLHTLEITAFGPFADTVKVDFDRLGADGLSCCTAIPARERLPSSTPLPLRCTAECRVLETRVSGCCPITLRLVRYRR